MNSPDKIISRREPFTLLSSQTHKNISHPSHEAGSGRMMFCSFSFIAVLCHCDIIDISDATSLMLLWHLWCQSDISDATVTLAWHVCGETGTSRIFKTLLAPFLRRQALVSRLSYINSVSKEHSNITEEKEFPREDKHSPVFQNRKVLEGIHIISHYLQKHAKKSQTNFACDFKSNTVMALKTDIWDISLANSETKWDDGFLSFPSFDYDRTDVMCSYIWRIKWPKMCLMMTLKAGCYVTRVQETCYTATGWIKILYPFYVWSCILFQSQLSSCT